MVILFANIKKRLPKLELLDSLFFAAQNSENLNPYAIFGCTPYVAGDKDAGATAEKVFVIENFSKGSKVARIEYNPHQF